jgi:2-polyprenyl-6-methoxyphenol hydroxylase-like FAD-dependent oxidoreductase
MKSLNSLLLLLLAGTSLAFQRPALVAHKSALFTTSGGGAVSTPEASAVPATKKSAVIVGGGPVGLATALTLSNAPHYYDITLVEQSPETSGYDPTKAYLYLVNPRGQVWTKRFPRVQELLEERGSMNTGMGNFVTVPGDPSEPVPDKLPAKDGEPSYWIPRHGMVTLL